MDDDQVMAIMVRQHGMITRAQARLTGMSTRQIDYRLRTGRWAVCSPGVYRHAQLERSWSGRVLEACLVHRALASHRTAAALHGIDGYQPGRIEVVVGAGNWRLPDDLHLHQSSQMDRTDPVTMESIPCTGLGRTVLDLAAVVSRRRLEFTVDAVIRSGRLGFSDLCGVLSSHSRRGRDGCGRLRELLDDRVGKTAVPLSDWSRMVSDLLVERGLPAPEFEHTVLREDGSFVAQVDLAYPEARVAIELDSVAWHLNREAFERDPRRRNRLVVAGWTVLAFTWADYVDHPRALYLTVRSTIREIRAAELQRM